MISYRGAILSNILWEISVAHLTRSTLISAAFEISITPLNPAPIDSITLILETVIWMLPIFILNLLQSSISDCSAGLHFQSRLVFMCFVYWVLKGYKALSDKRNSWKLRTYSCFLSFSLISYRLFLWKIKKICTIFSSNKFFIHTLTFDTFLSNDIYIQMDINNPLVANLLKLAKQLLGKSRKFQIWIW